MNQKHDIETLLDQLMDVHMSPEQRRQVEDRLMEDSAFKDLSHIKRMERVRQILHEIAKDAPAFNQPDFMWSRVKARIANEKISHRSWSDRLGIWFSLPRLAWAIVILMIVGAAFQMIPRSRYGDIWQVYSFKPEVTATAYNSKAGNATVIWVAGMDEYPSEFGQIWEVYTYKSEVTATAYNSNSGNATVIWISGMDYEENPLNAGFSL